MSGFNSSGLVITFFDSLALYYLIMMFVSFLKSKKQVILASAASLLFLTVCYYYFAVNNSGIVLNNNILFLFVVLLVNYIVNYLFPTGNHKQLVIVITFLTTVCLMKAFLFDSHEKWYFLFFLLPIIIEILSFDCSSMEGYTTLNVAHALLLALVSFTTWRAFPIICGFIYFVGSIFSYLKVNKLTALKNRNKKQENASVYKPNRAERRAQKKHK